MHRTVMIRVVAVMWAVALGLVSLAQADVIYSGRAFGDQLKLVNPSVNILTFADTGNLPPSGGSLSATLVTVLVGTGTLSSHTVTASASGSGGVATSSASQENLLAFSGQPAQLSASVVQAQAQAQCSGVQ